MLPLQTTVDHLVRVAIAAVRGLAEGITAELRRARARRLSLVWASAVSLLACGPATVSPSPTAVTSGPPGAGTCIEFESPLAVGDQFGMPAGNVSGDVVFTEAGIPVSVVDFLYSSSGGTFNYAEVMTASPGFGSGQVVFLNNINFEFDFTALGFIPGRVELEFRDQGGNENLAVNGDPSPPFHDNLTTTTTPSLLGGVGVSISTSSSGTGTAIFSGPVKKLLIGGQEFSLDHVCVFEESGGN